MQTTCTFIFQIFFKNNASRPFWHQHGKCIQMNTSMPNFGPMVLDIVHGILINKTSGDTFHWSLLLLWRVLNFYLPGQASQVQGVSIHNTRNSVNPIPYRHDLRHLPHHLKLLVFFQNTWINCKHQFSFEILMTLSFIHFLSLGAS